MYLTLIALVAAESTWEAAFRVSWQPAPRDYNNFEYFAAHVKNPEVVAHTLVEPMPIPDHWLFSVPKGQHKRAVDDLESQNIQVFPQKISKIKKRAPISSDKAAQGDVLAVPHDYSSDKCAPHKLSKRGEEELQAVRDEFNIRDPLFGNQWHIFNAETPGRDMNVMGAWRLGATGKNVTVAIVDDGLDHEHPDFQRSFYLEGSYDYNAHRQLPTPELADDWHGTRCAGEIAADLNDVCGVGIAPDAKVAGIRILSGSLTQNDEARALNHYIQHNDIFSCSWGPRDDGKHMEGPPAIVKRAIVNGIENGRSGLGSIYVQASGNGHAYGDNCNYDGYTNSIYSITVSSVDIYNDHPFYAESCSANLVSTYSSNRDTKITSSDPLAQHQDGSSPCTSLHTGTSASAPMVAGIVALLLDKRPDLTWRDVQYVCREAAIPFEIKDQSRGNWTTTHDNKLYHNDYGYGILDAENTVKVAESWIPVNPQTWFFTPHTDENINFSESHSSTIEVTEEDLKSHNFKRLEHVNVRLSYKFPKRGALRFKLTSPSNNTVTLSEPRPRDTSGVPVIDWTFSSVAHWGEKAAGKWTLIVENDEMPLGGEFGNWGLRLWGETEDPELVKKYSDMWDEENKPIDETAKSALEPAPETTLHATTPASATIQPDGETVSATNSIETAAGAATSVVADAPTGADKTVNEPTDAASTTPAPEVDYSSEKEHSMLFYLGCSFIGVVIILLAAVPITLWALKRRQQQVPYDYAGFGLLEDDMELDDRAFANDHDSFEISDDEPIRPVPIRPQDQEP